MPLDVQDKGAAREDLCRFLAACYYQPGPEFAEEKVFDSMLDAATRIHPDLAVHARRLGEEEGLFVGYSPGAAAGAAIQVAKTLDQGVVVTVFPDGGEKYLSITR